MPGGKGLCSTTVSLLNSGQVSIHTDHEKQHAPEEDGFNVTSISPFACHQGSVGAPTCLDISDEADHAKSQTPKGGILSLTPVSPSACGQGLPYAPENWPCPGDIWTWRVGRRINRNGFFNDRCLFPPGRLRTPETRKHDFRTKVSVEKYILTKFPEADLDEFFSSFSWSVPAKSLFRNEDTEKSEDSDKRETSNVFTHSNSREKKLKSGKFSSCSYKSHLPVMSKDKQRKKSRTTLRTSFTIPRGKRLKRSRVSPTNTESKGQSYQSCSNEPLSRETPSIVILASFSEDSGSINQHLRTTANTERNQVSSHNICSDQTVFPTLSCHESVATKAGVEDQNHPYHEGRMWSDALKFYSRRPKIQLLITSETEETSHGTHGEQRSKASLMEVQSNRQSCGSRSDKDLPCTETPELMIDASFNEDSGSINEQMRSAANTESFLRGSSHNICTDLVLFQSPSYEDTVACKANVKDDNHESSAETVDIDQYINSLEDMRTIANPESYQVSRHNICADLIPLPTPFCENSVACKASVKDGSNESSAETVKFDQYINSLDDLLAQPVMSGSTSVDTPEDLSPEKEMEEARAKLSSFFAMDFSVFVSSSMHFEFANVLGVLSKDPNLTTDQLVQLKLLEVIPLLRTRYLKEAKAIEEANNFFEDLSNKVAKVYSCKDEYNDFKKKEEHIQEEIDSNSLHLKKIEEQIALLLSQRDEVADTISDLKVQRNSLNSQKKDIVEIFLPGMVSRIQMANSKKVEWGSKKQKALERQAELKAVFVTIKDDILNRFICKTT